MSLPNCDDGAVIPALHQVASKEFRKAAQRNGSPFTLESAQAAAGEVPNYCAAPVIKLVAVVQEPVGD
jgi:hypothetical protein